MEVFHYVAHQLRDTPLFESKILRESNEERTGAFYNDFDQECPFQHDSTPTIKPLESLTQTRPILSVEEIDHAIIEAEKNEGIFSKHTSSHVNNECADFYSEQPNEEYYEKVQMSIKLQ